MRAVLFKRDMTHLLVDGDFDLAPRRQERVEPGYQLRVVSEQVGDSPDHLRNLHSGREKHSALKTRHLAKSDWWLTSIWFDVSINHAHGAIIFPRLNGNGFYSQTDIKMYDSWHWIFTYLFIRQVTKVFLGTWLYSASEREAVSIILAAINQLPPLLTTNYHGQPKPKWRREQAMTYVCNLYSLMMNVKSL